MSETRGRQRQTLTRKIELLNRSSERMIKALELPRDKGWWWFMRKEAWLHLQRAWEVMWMVLWRKD